jgi:hypothetical protein
VSHARAIKFYGSKQADRQGLRLFYGFVRVHSQPRPEPSAANHGSHPLAQHMRKLPLHRPTISSRMVTAMKDAYMCTSTNGDTTHSAACSECIRSQIHMDRTGTDKENITSKHHTLLACVPRVPSHLCFPCTIPSVNGPMSLVANVFGRHCLWLHMLFVCTMVV